MTKTATKPCLTTLANRFFKAQAAWHQAWVEHFKSLPVLDDGDFFRICAVLQKQVQSYRIDLGRTNGVEQACGEVFRLALVGEANYSLDEAVRFAATYSEVVHRLSTRYGRLFEFHGDSFGDFMDSLPLVGPQCFSLPLGEDDSDLRLTVQSVLVGKQKLARLITSGENYVRMHLGEQAEEFWRSALRRQSKKK